MTQILQVYKQYKIMPQLQDHQFRVAAVAQLICDNSTIPVDTKTVVETCLLHDMGNLLKFNLDLIPDGVKVKGLEHWKKVQQQMAEHYKSTDEHHVSLVIAKELNMPKVVIDCIDSISFIKIGDNYFSGTAEQKICNYADQRVSPLGVVSVTERMEDGKKRFQQTKRHMIPETERQEIYRQLYELEKELFSHSQITSTDITDESIEPIIAQLKSYEI